MGGGGDSMLWGPFVGRVRVKRNPPFSPWPCHFGCLFDPCDTRPRTHHDVGAILLGPLATSSAAVVYAVRSTELLVVYSLIWAASVVPTGRCGAANINHGRGPPPPPGKLHLGQLSPTTNYTTTVTFAVNKLFAHHAIHPAVEKVGVQACGVDRRRRPRCRCRREA